MPTINDYLKYAETAFAAYASNLVLDQGNVNAYRDNAKMAIAQAEKFDENWKVLGQQDLSNGFSAVLFQKIDPQTGTLGEKVLAIRARTVSWTSSRIL